jgi:hypothetical protein
MGRTLDDILKNPDWFEMIVRVENCKECSNYRASRDRVHYDEHCAEFKFSFSDEDFNPGLEIDPRCEWHNQQKEWRESQPEENIHRHLKSMRDDLNELLEPLSDSLFVAQVEEVIFKINRVLGDDING